MQPRSGPCLGSSRDHDSALSAGMACLTSAADITDIQLQRDTPALPVCVCVWKNKRAGRAESSSDRLAQQIACQCLIWKKFPSNSCHGLPGELRLKDGSGLDPNSAGAVHDTTLLRKTHEMCQIQAPLAGSQLSHGSGKSTGEASCPSNRREPVKRDPTWMNEHGPADRGRSQQQRERRGLLFSTEPRWH